MLAFPICLFQKGAKRYMSPLKHLANIIGRVLKYIVIYISIIVVFSLLFGVIYLKSGVQSPFSLYVTLSYTDMIRRFGNTYRSIFFPCCCFAFRRIYFPMPRSTNRRIPLYISLECIASIFLVKEIYESPSIWYNEKMGAITKQWKNAGARKQLQNQRRSTLSSCAEKSTKSERSFIKSRLKMTKMNILMATRQKKMCLQQIRTVESS